MSEDMRTTKTKNSELLTRLLTLEQLAEVFGVTYARAAELARENVIPVVRLGPQIRVDPNALERFIADGGKALPGGWKRTAV
jgi:excisionase family DNA binding protein